MELNCRKDKSVYLYTGMTYYSTGDEIVMNPIEINDRILEIRNELTTDLTEDEFKELKKELDQLKIEILKTALNIPKF